MTEAACRALIMPHLEPARRIEMTVPLGASISDMIAQAFPGLHDHSQVRVYIGGAIVPFAWFDRVRPKAGTQVILRLVPAGNTTRAILSAVVMVAALVVAPYVAGPIISAVGATGLVASGITAATTAGLVYAGSLLVNALVPYTPPAQQAAGGGGSSSPTYSIQGFRNVPNPGGPVPLVLGRERFAPVYAALPYTESIGDDQYVTAAFLVGFGPLTISDIRIGETPIEEFDDVQYEVREGLIDDAPLTLYPRQVIEEALAVDCLEAAPVVRLTAADCTEVDVEFLFPQGLWRADNDDQKVERQEVTIQIRQRLYGSGSWAEVDTFNVEGKKQMPLRRGYHWTLPTRGRYEIEVTRLSQDHDQNDRRSNFQWSVLRSIRPEYPIAFPKPLALVAVRIRASNQLNGTLDNLNLVAESQCLDFGTVVEGEWVITETNNPASLYRHILQGPANVFPKTNGEIDLEALAQWHEFCVDKGLAYNRVHDFKSSLWSAMGDCARAGRASPFDTGERWSVVVDRIKTEVAAHISPRNSWDFSGSRTYPKLPDAYRVPFRDETNDYRDAERVVPFPGFVGEPQVFEELQHPGITNPDLIWKETRRRQYEILHRPDTYVVNQDVESFVVTRGDLARLNHDVLDRDHIAARVKSVSGSVVTFDEEFTIEDGKTYACRFRAANGSSILRSVSNAAGVTSSLSLIGDLSLVSPGDLALFGTTTRGEAIEAIVKDIESGENMNKRITLVDHAPQIEELVDAEVPPAWDGRVGEIIEPGDMECGVPIIVGIDSDPDHSAVVILTPTAGWPPAQYEVRHKLSSDVSWDVSTVVVPAVTGVAAIDGYIANDEIEVQARALNSLGSASDYSASSFHTVEVVEIPEIDSFTATDIGGGFWRFEWTIAAPDPGVTLLPLSGVRIRYAANHDQSWDDLDPLHTGTVTASPYDRAFTISAGNYTFGIVPVTAGGDLGEPYTINVTV